MNKDGITRFINDMNALMEHQNKFTRDLVAFYAHNIIHVEITEKGETNDTLSEKSSSR